MKELYLKIRTETVILVSVGLLIGAIFGVWFYLGIAGFFLAAHAAWHLTVKKFGERPRVAVWFAILLMVIGVPLLLFVQWIGPELTKEQSTVAEAINLVGGVLALLWAAVAARRKTRTSSTSGPRTSAKSRSVRRSTPQGPRQTEVVSEVEVLALTAMKPLLDQLAARPEALDEMSKEQVSREFAEVALSGLAGDWALVGTRPRG